MGDSAQLPWSMRASILAFLGAISLWGFAIQGVKWEIFAQIP